MHRPSKPLSDWDWEKHLVSKNYVKILETSTRNRMGDVLGELLGAELGGTFGDELGEELVNLHSIGAMNYKEFALGEELLQLDSVPIKSNENWSFYKRGGLGLPSISSSIGEQCPPFCFDLRPTVSTFKHRTFKTLNFKTKNDLVR
jgi:hypothetical protein